MLSVKALIQVVKTHIMDTVKGEYILP